MVYNKQAVNDKNNAVLEAFKGYRIEIDLTTYNRVQAMFNAVEQEIGALASFKIDHDKCLITLSDFFIPRQTVTGGDVDFDDEGEGGTNDVIFQCVEKGININGWIHSHVNMSAFWSSTDLGTIHKLRDHFDGAPLVSIVGNKRWEWVGRVDFPVVTPFGRNYIHLDNIPVNVVTPNLNLECADLLERIKTYVQPRAYNNYYRGGYYQNGIHYPAGRVSTGKSFRGRWHSAADEYEDEWWYERGAKEIEDSIEDVDVYTTEEIANMREELKRNFLHSCDPKIDGLDEETVLEWYNALVI